jgi:hypothetical protein
VEEEKSPSIIDEKEYKKFKTALKKYELNDKNRKWLEDNNMPYQTFKDMKGFNDYIAPTVRASKKTAKMKDLSFKQGVGIDDNDIHNFQIGDMVYIDAVKETKKGIKDNSKQYIIVGIDGEDVEIRETMPASATVKRKANAVAKYEIYHREMDRLKDIEDDSEQLSLFQEESFIENDLKKVMLDYLKSNKGATADELVEHIINSSPQVMSMGIRPNDIKDIANEIIKPTVKPKHVPLPVKFKKEYRTLFKKAAQEAKDNGLKKFTFKPSGDLINNKYKFGKFVESVSKGEYSLKKLYGDPVDGETYLIK